MSIENKIILTAKEREIIKHLGDSLYTPEFVEENINRHSDAFSNVVCALQECTAEGFYRAVKLMAKLESKGDK